MIEDIYWFQITKPLVQVKKNHYSNNNNEFDDEKYGLRRKFRAFASSYHQDEWIEQPWAHLLGGDSGTLESRPEAKSTGASPLGSEPFVYNPGCRRQLKYGKGKQLGPEIGEEFLKCVNCSLQITLLQSDARLLRSDVLYLSFFFVDPDFPGMIGIFGEGVWSGMFLFFSSSCIRSLKDWIGEESLITPPLKSNTREELRSVLDVRNTITGSEDSQIFVTEQEHIANPSKHFIAFPCKLFGEFRVLLRQHCLSWQACLVSTGARNPKIWNSIPRGNTFFKFLFPTLVRRRGTSFFKLTCFKFLYGKEDSSQICHTYNV